MPGPRVRIAPSPTGYFHVGTARPALFNWLFARQHGGTFILRIEDTDTARNRAEYTAGIQRAMQWLGLDWDEGPYFQSQRGALYADAVAKLVAAGAVYACECTPTQVDERNRAVRRPPGYDGYCRDRGLELTEGRLLRFRTPDQGSTTFNELVKGDNGRLSSPNGSIEDFGVRKSNGDPLFLLANVVDDADMAITHVIRGDDHVSNTYKYALLWEALGYGPLPVFAHLPLLLNEQRKKLSKRRDKVAVEDYRDEGYLPEAVVNALALLGWSPGGDREILSHDEMLAEFRLEDVKSAPAVFDERKMQAFNAEYLRALSSAEFVDRSSQWLRARWEPIAPQVQERARTLSEVFAMTDFLFRDPPVIDEEEWARAVAKQPGFAPLLDAAIAAYGNVDWQADPIKAATLELGARVGVPSLGKAQAPIRLAVTGRSVGPPLFESLELLGRERTLARLIRARARLGEAPSRPDVRLCRPRALWRKAAIVAGVGLVYVLANLGTVWWASTRQDSTRVQAIVVLGAAQYDGTPSPDLAARLSHALTLYRHGVAPTIVVTGGREPGDPYTEAEASADWLAARGVPQSVILREVDGRDTWESLDATAAFLHQRGIRSVVMVSDPYHEERVKLIAEEVGLDPHLSSTTTSPIRGAAVVPYFAKEALEVSVGRVVGFRALAHVDRGWGGVFGLG